VAATLALPIFARPYLLAFGQIAAPNWLALIPIKAL
jgi:hypothetical protein